jgi:hypothetical protein
MTKSSATYFLLTSDITLTENLFLLQMRYATRVRTNSATGLSENHDNAGRRMKEGDGLLAAACSQAPCMSDISCMRLNTPTVTSPPHSWIS